MEQALTKGQHDHVAVFFKQYYYTGRLQLEMLNNDEQIFTFQNTLPSFSNQVEDQ
jgi:hypothetical protein